MKILFIDDDDIRTKPLREGLVGLGGYEVVFIRTPELAVEKFEENPGDFQAIVVDIMLPHYDIPEYRDFTIPKYFSNNYDGMFTGLRILLQFRGIMKEKKIEIPLIVLTCIGDIEKYLNELSLKVNKILLKPISLTDFLVEIKNVLSA